MTLGQKLKAPALCVLGAAVLTLAQPAVAAPLFEKTLAGPATTKVEPVRYRGWHHGGWRHGWHRGYGWRDGYYRRGPGLGALAAGAIIGSAIANSQARASNSEAYCEQKYKSYDPASGTYLGYDGDRHPCP